MLPCPYGGDHGHPVTGDHGGEGPESDDTANAEPASGEHNRRLLWSDRRFLSAGSEAFSCKPVTN